MGVGMPATLFLEEFGSHVKFVFDEYPFLVGSALTKKKWRDVDVRLVLDDEVYERLGLGDPIYPFLNGKWVSLCLAYSALGEKLTGLPIDFQIQQKSYAEQVFQDKEAHFIGLVPLRLKKEE